jgi:hypothetical protein
MNKNVLFFLPFRPLESRTDTRFDKFRRIESGSDFHFRQHRDWVLREFSTDEDDIHACTLCNAPQTAMEGRKEASLMFFSHFDFMASSAFLAQPLHIFFLLVALNPVGTTIVLGFIPQRNFNALQISQRFRIIAARMFFDRPFSQSCPKPSPFRAAT